MNKFFSRFGILIVLVILIVFFSIMAENFLSFTNFMNILRQVSFIGISALGMTIVIITGGIDLTMGSSVSVISVGLALLMVNTDIPVVFIVLIGLIMGVGIGAVNGVVITKFKVPPLIATLALMLSIRGVSYILTRGMPVSGFPKSFAVIGKGYVFGIPVPVIIMVVVFVFGWILLNKTRFGRYVYAIGGNREATRLSGVDVHKNLILSYIICGVLGSISAIVILSRLGSGMSSTAGNFAFDVLTAVVLGGVSISGGEGRLEGVIFGVLVMGVLSNGMVLMNVYEYYQMVIKGLVLLAAVGFDQYTKTRRLKPKLIL